MIVFAAELMKFFSRSDWRKTDFMDNNEEFNQANDGLFEDEATHTPAHTTFQDLGLEDAILDALKVKGYEIPTPIQEQVIPILLEGGIDVIGQAQTGTGKTAAFGLPILQNVEEGRRATQALVLAPTRELAIQVATEINSFKGRKRLNVVTVYGGQSITQQIKDLNKGADIVVGTPGRVIDLIKRKKLKVNEVEYFVLDEADEMLNMGFIDDIEWIMGECNEDRQMLLFSATMPTKIKKLAKKYMGDYELVAVKKKEVTTENTEQVYYPVYPRDRFKILERILLMEQNFYGIIFSNTKMTADDITRKLVKDGIKAEALHGDIAQNQRERILRRFKDRKCTVLVATDVAARGIDVNDLTHVINYGLPQDAEAYVHRIGRTGRAGKKGKAISLVANQEHKQLVLIEGIAKTKIKKEYLPDAETLLDNRKIEIVKNVVAEELYPSDEHFAEMADEILMLCDGREALVKALKKAYSSQLNLTKFKAIDQPKDLKSGGGAADEMRIFVALGKRDGYNKQKLEDYFVEKTGIDTDSFLDTYLLDEFSFITVPYNEGVIILNVFKKIRRNGREIVSTAKAKGSGGGGNNRRSGGGGGGRRDRGRNSGGGRKRGFSGKSSSGNQFDSGFSNNYGPKRKRNFQSKRKR